VGHCQAPNTRNPAHSSGVFYCLKFSLTGGQAGTMVLFPAVFSDTRIHHPSQYRRVCGLSLLNIYSKACILDIKSTECDASTFLVMPALV
ncbi:hypothetical protein, partial [Aeromonas caviae]|uniref:hypothetical protein n=2 Tax=Aeromonas caviae TaxID=648 RepID=UPI002B48B663